MLHADLHVGSDAGKGGVHRDKASEDGDKAPGEAEKDENLVGAALRAKRMEHAPVDEIDHVAEAATGSDTPSGDGDGQVGFACAGAANQHDVALLGDEATAVETVVIGLDRTLQHLPIIPTDCELARRADLGTALRSAAAALSNSWQSHATFEPRRNCVVRIG